MIVRGKRNRGVPVIIPLDISATVQYLATPDIRDSVGVLSENKFLFPNSRLGSVRTYDSLQKMTEESSVKAPSTITSVTLRKYTTTLTQVLNLEGNQIQWLCDHLGHSKRTHLGHYRQLSGFIERVQISKLMLIQDNNLVKKFSGRKLDEIDVSEIIFPDEGASDDAAQADDVLQPHKKRRTQAEDELFLQMMPSVLEKMPSNQNIEKRLHELGGLKLKKRN